MRHLIYLAVPVLFSSALMIAKADTPPARDRRAIQDELDANHESVKDLYAVLDLAAPEEKGLRRFLQGMIQQNDDRNDVLFGELDAIDREELFDSRRAELIEQARTLEDEAKQLRASKHPLPAAAREAKARSIRKSLEDGTWKVKVAEAWTISPEAIELAPQIKLVADVADLQEQNRKLRAQVDALEGRLETLQQQINRLTTGVPK